MSYKDGWQTVVSKATRLVVVHKDATHKVHKGKEGVGVGVGAGGGCFAHVANNNDPTTTTSLT